MVNGGGNFYITIFLFTYPEVSLQYRFFFYKYISPSLLCKYTLQHCKKDILFRFLFEVCFV